MKQQLQRKSTPQVVGGRVQKKNNPEWTANYDTTPPSSLVIDRQRPGKGYRHLLLQRDIEAFIRLLPDWAELSRGLNAIVLAPGQRRWNGWCSRHVVAVCAWEADLWGEFRTNSTFFCDHEPIFRRFGVLMEASDGGYTLCKFTESQIKADQLLHILLHEFGHHHDRLTTKPSGRPNRGEAYAEQYALAYEARIWEHYQQAFGGF